MAVTDDGHIQLLVKQLDEAVPRQGHVELLADPDDYETRRVRANRLGYLRLGVELLKLAYAPPTSGDGKRDVVRLDVGYLTGLGDCDYYFERCEDVWSPAYGEPPGALAQIGRGVIILLIIGPFLLGAYTVLNWLVGAIFWR